MAQCEIEIGKIPELFEKPSQPNLMGQMLGWVGCLDGSHWPPDERVIYLPFQRLSQKAFQRGACAPREIEAVSTLRNLC